MPDVLIASAVSTFWSPLARSEYPCRPAAGQSSFAAGAAVAPSHQNRPNRSGEIGPPKDRSIHTPFQVGKYLVSPLTRLLDRDRYAASVSIRSGRGSGTHDRVLRLLPVFKCRDAAARYACEQGRAWIHAAAATPSLQTE